MLKSRQLMQASLGLLAALLIVIPPLLVSAAPKPKSAALTAGSSPTDVVKAFLTKRSAFVDNSKTVNQESSIDPTLPSFVKMMDQYIDLEKLAKLSLDKHWDKISKAQKKEFMQLFRTLVDGSFRGLSRATISNAKPKFTKEEIKGNKAKVYMSEPRSDVDVDHVLELHHVDGHWKIYNNTRDGRNLMLNYRSEFNRTIF